MKIATVGGTRPELIKLAPLVSELRTRFRHAYVFTGQHFSPSLVRNVLDDLRAAPPDVYLDVASSDVDAISEALTRSLAGLRPDVVVVYGDTNSTVAGARAAKALGAVLVHVEAGLRSFDASMPEERNRIEVDDLADLLLAPTGLAASILIAVEGRDPELCPIVGNLVVDAWRLHRELVEARPFPPSLARVTGRYALLTLHRAGIADDPALLRRAFDELEGLDLPVVFPMHPRTASTLDRAALVLPHNVLTCEPLPYLDFMRVLSTAAVALTDSGGVQEEAITVGVPCVTLRANTERMETVIAGANRLFDPGADRDLPQTVFAAVRGHRPPARSPFGSGQAAYRITALLELMDGRPPTVEAENEPGFASNEELRAAAARVRPLLR